MNKLIKYLFAFTCIILWSCEKEAIENSNIVIAKPDNIKYLNAEELPAEFQNYFIKKNTSSSSKSNSKETDLSNAIFTEFDIISMTDDKNITNYSISFYYPDTPENIFYNLVINVLPTGENSKYIFKYICNPADFQNFKAHNFDFKYFVGFTEISLAATSSNGTLTSKMNSGDEDCPKIYIPTPDSPNSSGTGPSGSGGSSSSSGSSGFNTSVPGYNSPGHTGGSSPGPSTGGSGGHDHSGCFGSNGQYWRFAGDVRPPHSHNEKKAIDCPDLVPPLGSVPVITMPMIKVLGKELALSTNQIAFLRDHTDIMIKLNTNLTISNFSYENKIFTKEIIDILLLESTIDLNAFEFILSAQANNKINTELDEAFLSSVDQYMDADIADIKTKDPDLIIYFGTHQVLRTLRLKALNPEWSYLKCYWEASKEVVHITLDVFGTVPVAGELADITNGVLYLIEGDGVNATLSMAGAVPFYGWAAVSTKYAIKLKEVSVIATKVKLVWKVTGDVITFGSRNQLRKVLGLAVGDLRQAHHIIPWNKQSKLAIQKASKSQHAFHMNEAINGIPLDKAIHNGSHPHYDDLIDKYLRNISPNATPDQAYDKVMEIITKVRTAIQNNPNVPLNQLNF